MIKKLLQSLSFVVPLLAVSSAWSFCGFFVAKADTKLFNKASRVIIARDQDRTVMTMANDFQGEIKDFAIVVPVPVVLKKDQVHVGDPKILERLDAFTAPRLVEYFDPDPCHPVAYMDAPSAPESMRKSARDSARSRALGVTIEAQFTVGEYDILILSAKESSGLETWLTENGYKIPSGARELLQPYIRQNMKFFVAKVNLREFEKRGFQMLRPIQMAYESPKFMLPIRLGMANAESEQELIAFMLSPVGRIEVTNYRMVSIPSDAEVPLYIKDDFGKFYGSMFERSYNREGKNVVFLEYAWDMNWCDPCAADPLSPEELRKAGVFWLDEAPQEDTSRRPVPAGTNVYVTRLHVRYSRPKFPEDLAFQATPNRENFQGRYILRHPFKGPITCSEGRKYKRELFRRQQEEVQTLARLTGWNVDAIRKAAGLQNRPKEVEEEESWWKRVFGNDDEDD